MGLQRIMRTTTEDTTVLDRARKAMTMGQIVSYQEKKLKKVKNGWEEVDKKAFARIVIIQV